MSSRPLVALLLLFAGSGCAKWSPAFDARGRWFMNLSARSAADVWAVGGTQEQGAVMHFDGETWSEVPLDEQVPLLNWVHPFAADDVFVVGNGGTILHFDGKGWTKAAVPTTDPLWGVWGASPDDVWAVGGSGFGSGQPWLLHFDGAEWTPQELPPLSRQNVYALYKVWGTGRDDVRVVGQDGVALHFDGARWEEEDTGAKDDLISLWGTGPDHVVAVGGRGSGLVSVWDGQGWRTRSLSPLPGLNGVWLDSGEEAWVAGGGGTLGRIDLRTLEFHADGADTSLDLHSVFGVEHQLFAVGGNLLVGASTGRYQGIALQRPE